MQDAVSELVNELARFLETHFHEIVLIILALAILDVAIYLVGSDRKNNIIVLSGCSLST